MRMTGQPALLALVEHAPTGVVGGIGGFILRELWNAFRNRKPLEEQAGSVVESFATLTDHLERRIKAQDEQIEQQAEQIKTMRAESHKVRNDLQKVRAWADLVLRWASRLEEQVREAGLEPEPRPELPILS